MLAALDLSHVRALNAGQVRKRFLGDALARSLIANGGPKRDGWFCFVGGRAGGSASLNWALLHQQKRRALPVDKPR
jgi:hypothetical protein